MFRLVHSVSYNFLQALLDVNYRTARACFQDMVMFEVMKVVHLGIIGFLMYNSLNILFF